MTDHERTVWGVTSYDRGGNTGYVVHCLFLTVEDAQRYAQEGDQKWRSDGHEEGTYSIEPFVLYDEVPPVYIYWHRGAKIYPDGTVEDWTVKHHDQPPDQIAPLDDPLEAFNGHIQGHCGWHVSIFGSDRDAVERAYQTQLANVLARCDGVCAFCGARGTFEAEFWGETRSAVPLPE